MESEEETYGFILPELVIKGTAVVRDADGNIKRDEPTEEETDAGSD